MSLEPPAARSYDPLDTTLSLVFRRDDLDPFSSEDDQELKAEMSCSHAVTAESLIQSCRSQLEQGIYRFTCPALVNGVNRCNAPLSYPEVRRLAALSVEEMQHFEETIARLAAAQYLEVQSCPRCKTSVERRNLSNLCVKCTVCTADRNRTFQFCWQCMKEWKGPAPRSDRCAADGCVNETLRLLRTCGTVSLPRVQGVDACPSIRACPTCGVKVEHSREHCKNIACRRCRVEFCFVCLKLKRDCNPTSGPYTMCSDGVAPRQTAVPAWDRR